MPKANHNDRRDDNERAIICALQARGDIVKKLPRGFGADLLVMHGSSLYFVEVKNPGTRWRYTKSEIDFQYECNQRGIPYHVIFYVADI